MRVLYLHPTSWSGEYTMLRALAAAGEDVRVLEESRRPGSDKRRVSPDYRTEGDGIRTLWYNPHRGWEKGLTWPFDRIFRRAFDGRNLAHRMWVIVEALRRFKPDVVVCSDGFTYAIPAAFLKRLLLLKGALVVSYIGGDVLDCPEADVGRRRTPMVNWLLRQSFRDIDVMRVLCESLGKILLHDGAQPERIRMLPMQLGLPHAQLDSIRKNRVAARLEIRRRHDIDAAAPVIVTMSGNRRGKGLHLLAEVWPDIVRAIPSVRWLLCGPNDPWLAHAVWPVLHRSGYAASVASTGLVGAEEVFMYFAGADLHVNPTLCEGLNVASIEAAAVGTPTITSDGAGISEWLLRYDAGAVVPRMTAEPLADAIINALRDPVKLERWGRNSPAMADEFSLERIAPAMQRLLQETVSGRRSAASP